MSIFRKSFSPYPIVLAGFIVIYELFSVFSAKDGFSGVKSQQKFKTVFTITYNAISLEEAAKLEKKLMKEHSDACDLSISLSKADGLTTLSQAEGDTIITIPYYDGQRFLQWDFGVDLLTVPTLDLSDIPSSVTEIYDKVGTDSLVVKDTQPWFDI